jgi:hypothetical protein
VPAERWSATQDCATRREGAQSNFSPIILLPPVASGAVAALAARHALPAMYPLREYAGSALLYASNTFAANKAAYKLEPLDLAVVVVLRHFSTPFGYTDAIWQPCHVAPNSSMMFAGRPVPSAVRRPARREDHISVGKNVLTVSG